VRLMLLSEMLTELRHEARISADAAHGLHLRNSHIALLRRTQEAVYHAYDWENLKVTANVTLAPGQRYSAYPEAFEFEGITGAFQKNLSGDYVPLGYGIGSGELNEIDSDADERREDPARWQNYLSLEAETINTNMFEIWPLPERETVIRFEGKRKLMPLTDPADDRSTVDGTIVVLHAASELLAAKNAEDAVLKIQKAQERFDLMKQRTAAPSSAGNRTVPNNGGSGVYNPQRFRVR
jgi:hypothetical protein